MANQEQQLNTAIRDILERSVVDPEFRKLAVRDGAAALKQVGVKNPAPVMSVSFVDNYGRSHKTIVLPDPISESELLTEDELDQVAGGGKTGIVEITNCCTSADGD